MANSILIPTEPIGSIPRTTELIKENIRDNQRVFVGVIDPINAEVETPETVRDRIIEASEHIPLNQLGTTDDCGYESDNF